MLQKSQLALGLAVFSTLVSVGSTVVTQRQIRAFDSNPAAVSPEAVRQALLHNPSMMVEAGQKLQALQMEAQRIASIGVANGMQEDLLAPTPGIIGNPNGRRVMVNFFDYQCGHCREDEPKLREAATADPELKILLVEIPILEVAGQNSLAATLAALAAGRQGRYMQMHDALMTAPLPLSEAAVMVAARSAGVDVDRLRTDMGSEPVRAAVLRNQRLAERLRVSGTPSFAAPGAGVLVGFGSIPRFQAYAQNVTMK